MVANHRVRAAILLGLPAAAAVRGMALSLAHLSPQWIPYYLVFAVYNYRAMARELIGHLSRARRRRSPGASA
jgi:hypothetical protein